jgi:hypothetical protein
MNNKKSLDLSHLDSMLEDKGYSQKDIYKFKEMIKDQKAKQEASELKEYCKKKGENG